MDKKVTAGVIVARFQAHKMHPGWHYLIKEVQKRHPEKMLIALGVHGGLRTKRDPLTYSEREHMVRESYPEESIVIRPIRNHPFSNKLWSRNLDTLIKETFPGIEATLYASDDGFIPNYFGEFPTEFIPPEIRHSGTALRTEARMPTTEAGREAVIYAQHERPDMLYSTVDMAITDKLNDRVLLISKGVYDGLWSFPGGFAEPASDNDREDAMREFAEEILGVKVKDFACLTPYRIRMNDPRYRESKDGTRTSLYRAEYMSGDATGGDDAEGAQWFPRADLLKVLVPWHKPLGEILEAQW